MTAAPPGAAPDAVDEAAAAVFAAAYAGVAPTPLVVVIAAFNEQGAVGGVVRRVPATVCGLAASTVVVVDGASDATAAEAAEAGALVCDVAVNRGQGAALRLGYRLARDRGAELIATLDADGQFDPAELAAVVGPLVAGQADFVSGSRRLGRSLTTDRVRRLGVVVFARVISVLGGQRVTDPANGLRAMRAELTAAVPLRQPQYQAAELLLGAARLGYRLAEVPTTMHRRHVGASKKGPNLLYGWRFARVIAATWWGVRPSSVGPAKTNHSKTANLARKSTP